jgi:hypothetical protein
MERLKFLKYLASFGYQSGDLQNDNPRRRTGIPNQKPLTIKPYPMKIQYQYNGNLVYGKLEFSVFMQNPFLIFTATN